LLRVDSERFPESFLRSAGKHGLCARLYTGAPGEFEGAWRRLAAALEGYGREFYAVARSMRDVPMVAAAPSDGCFLAYAAEDVIEDAVVALSHAVASAEEGVLRLTIPVVQLPMAVLAGAELPYDPLGTAYAFYMADFLASLRAVVKRAALPHLYHSLSIIAHYAMADKSYIPLGHVLLEAVEAEEDRVPGLREELLKVALTYSQIYAKRVGLRELREVEVWGTRVRITEVRIEFRERPYYAVKKPVA